MSETEPRRRVATAFCLHFLGGSAREWQLVKQRLDPSIRLVAIDLPGFGDAAGLPGASVAEMAERVMAIVRAAAPPRWLLVGHSMGAKVAAAVARAAEDGATGLSGLVGLVLLAGSPPGPEPMAASQRATMLGWFAGDPASCREQARGYIAQNLGAPLDAALNEQAVGDVLRANRDAWVAWLERGSREDWATRIGVLRTSAVIVAGAEDGPLGPDAQRDLMAPHFAQARLVTLPGAGHLLPMERPDHVGQIIVEQALADLVGADYASLIASDRVSARTRAALLDRATPDDPDYRPRTMSAEQLATLRAVTARIVPRSGEVVIDLAARIDRMLAASAGDGWRFAALPPDPEAYRAALDTLNATSRARHARGFTELPSSEQEELLYDIADGDLGAGFPLDAQQMRLWFEDARAEATRAYVAHPAILAHLGYNGIGYGGDGEPKPGFAQVGLDEREAWEPDAAP